MSKLKNRKRHTPWQAITKLRQADAMLNAGQEMSHVLQTLEMGESTLFKSRIPNRCI